MLPALNKMPHLPESPVLYGMVESGNKQTNKKQVSLEEASTSIDRALNATLSQLFSGQRAASEHSMEALTQLRFPPESEREIAKAAEIYERTLQVKYSSAII
jgi:hypothetical protein